MTPIETLLKFTNELLAGIRDAEGMYFVGQRIGLLAVQQVAQKLVDNGATAEIREEAAQDLTIIQAETACERIIESTGVEVEKVKDAPITLTIGRHGGAVVFMGKGASYFSALVDLLSAVKGYTERFRMKNI